MPATRELRVRQDQVLLMVGTAKGLFLFASNPGRDQWELGGPFMPGSPIYSVARDARGGERLFASVDNPFFGTTLRMSDDLGKTWSDGTTGVIKFPEDTGLSLKRIWQIVPAGKNGTLYAGVEPSSLFVSHDRGEHWELVRGLHEHPHRAQWQPGAGGMCLHTILPHPTNADEIVVAMSTGGVYRTRDGGATWEARNVGVRAEFMPDKYPEFGQCVHKVVRHPARPDTLFLQNHWGLYRSDNGGDSWQDIANGVPSDFGFCMAIHPHDPEVVYIVPLEADMYRCTPEGKMRVYRTLDGGKHWEALTNGLPQKNAHETVLRDALCVDALNPAGVYFGTRSGKVYASPDGGASWNLVVDGLPAVQVVRAYYMGDPAKARIPRGRAAKAKPAATKRAPVRAKAAPKQASKKKAAKQAVKKSAKKGAKKATKQAMNKAAKKPAKKAAKKRVARGR
ncbi:MAG: exo-alpha-sialidase [Candidatus Eisenbacteria bacterium]